MNIPRHGLEGPAVHYGQLEDLLHEAQTARQGGHLVFVRAALNSRSRSGHMGIGEEIRVILVVSSLILLTDHLPQYGQWVGSLAGYAEVNGHEMGGWTRAESARLGEMALQAAKNVIFQDYGFQTLCGQYMLSQEWLAVPGFTDLLDIALLRRLVKPPDGMQAHCVPHGAKELVLGALAGADQHFERFDGQQALLSRDSTLTLCSPDLTSQWLLFPVGYEHAIASWEPGERPTILYHPETGWIPEKAAVAAK